MGKWETVFWFSTFPCDARRGGGNVKISRCLRDFQGTVGRVENLGLVFHSSHGPGISTAVLRYQRKRGGGIGDSLLQARNSLTLAALICLAHSVSLIARANRSNRSKPIPSLR